jgi:hypothetical protein
MKRKILALAVLLLVGHAAHAGAVTIIEPGRTAPSEPPSHFFTAWAAEAEAHVPTTPGTVTVLADRCCRAEVEYADPTTIHWYSATGPLDETSHGNFDHELGHTWDLTLTPRQRRYLHIRFARLIYPGGRWRNPIFWRFTPNAFTTAELIELFAMAYSYCALGEYRPPTFYGYGYRPGWIQDRRACGLIRRTGELAGEWSR